MITLTVNEILTAVLLIAAIAALVYLIIVLARLLPGTRKLSEILDNVAEITEGAKPAMEKVNEILDDVSATTEATKTGVEGAANLVDNVSDSLSDITGILTGNRSKVTAATNLINAFVGLSGVMRGRGRSTGARNAQAQAEQTGQAAKKRSRKK